jgi:hypothetical protein
MRVSYINATLFYTLLFLCECIDNSTKSIRFFMTFPYFEISITRYSITSLRKSCAVDTFPAIRNC